MVVPSSELDPSASLRETEHIFPIPSINYALVFLSLELSPSFRQNTGFLDHRYSISREGSQRNRGLSLERHGLSCPWVEPGIQRDGSGFLSLQPLPHDLIFPVYEKENKNTEIRFYT